MIDVISGHEEVDRALAKINGLELPENFIYRAKEIKTRTGISGDIGSIALAGGLVESGYQQVRRANVHLIALFERHGEATGHGSYEIPLPEDQVLVVRSTREPFVVEFGAAIFDVTGLRNFPARALRYEGEGFHGTHTPAQLFALGPNGYRVEIKTEHHLSLHKIPDGSTFAEYFAGVGA